MNRPAAGGFVAHLECLADERPTVYRLAVLALALAGYAYLAGVVLLGFLVLAGLITVALATRLPGLVASSAAAIVVFLFVVFRSLWVRLPGAELVYGFLVAHGRTAKAEPWQQRAADRRVGLQTAETERSTLLTSDTYLPAGLAHEVLERLREQLASLADVKRALVVRKHVTHLPEQPLYVLAVEANDPWWQRNFYTPRVKHRARDLRAQLPRQVNLPTGSVFVIFGESTGRLQQIWREVPGSEIYRR